MFLPRRRARRGPPPAVLQGFDRRTRQRHPAGPKVSCSIEVAEGLPPYSAKVIDLCAHGVGLSIAHPLPQGATLRVTLITSAGLVCRTLDAVVRHVCERPEGVYLLGCRFGRSLAYPDLRAMLA
jgi:hypothetical protein